MTRWGSHHKGVLIVPGVQGFVARDAIVRFAEKCRFDPFTGCVLWEGAKCWGRGKNIRYGGFWYDGKVWKAHRWAAKFIHGHEIDGLQVDHCCDLHRAGPLPMLPDTLCVEHVRPLSDEQNRHLQTERRRHYVEVQVGLRDYEEIYGPPPELPPEAIPFYQEPEWLRKALT